MKRYLILFSILVVGMLAIVDAKTRLDELEEVAATTPSQVEMQREIPKSSGAGVMNKLENTPSQLAFPQNPNNNAQVQNSPQKQSAKFKNLQKPDSTNNLQSP